MGTGCKGLETGGAGGVEGFVPVVVPGITTGSPVGGLTGSPVVLTITSGKQSIDEVWYIVAFVGWPLLFAFFLQTF